MRLLTKRLARAATLAAALVSSSGSFATGRPLFATLGDVAFKLTAGFSEVEQVRRKINRRAGAKTRSEELDACFLVRDHNGQKPRMSISRASRVGERRPSCWRAMRRHGSPCHP
jgi:hypothetical protein